MTNYHTFTGVVITVEAPAGTPPQDIAAMARAAFMEQAATLQPHDIGVNIIGEDN